MLQSKTRSRSGLLKVHFDVSCGTTLRELICKNSDYFVQTNASSADVILFGSDEVEHVRTSSLCRTYAHKCLCITESDTPTFRLRGLYAANRFSPLTKGRTCTINYLISERERGNAAIREMTSERVEKRYLYTFMGGTNSWVRKRLLKSVPSSADVLIEATDSYNHWSDEGEMLKRRASQMQRYARTMAASKFALCPRGCGLSSYRLFESMSLSVAPVIIADRWKPVEEIDWSFALFVPERAIGRIDQIVRAYQDEWEQRGQAARRAYLDFFSQEAIGKTLHRKLSMLLAEFHPATEPFVVLATEARAAVRAKYWQLYRAGKPMILKVFYLTGVPFPFPLHQPIEQQIGKTRKAVER